MIGCGGNHPKCCIGKVKLSTTRLLLPLPAEAREVRYEKDPAVKYQIASLVLLAGLAVTAVADENKTDQPTPAAITKQTADPLPDAVKRFNGMLVGRLVNKDVEQGTFIINVDAVPRVWRNSKAEAPKQLVGKNIQMTGVTGKWLDVLLLVNKGETLEVEARHDDGDKLTFPGEMLRKVAPYKASDYPTLPAAFRGFNGAVAAKIIKKDPQQFELIIAVDRVIETFKRSQAKDPRSIEGKQLMLAGFWNRKDAYHGLKVGDNIEVGLQHVGRQSDHLNVHEFVRKAGTSQRDQSSRAEQESKEKMAEVGMRSVRGFKGVLIGRLIEKDVERGTFTLAVDRVPRVWNNNSSDNPKALLGKEINAAGLTGKHLDALLVTRKGETIEFGAFGEDGGKTFRVVEMFRKVAPVKPGDYPELPDAFRGFQGVVVGKIVKKDAEHFQLSLEVSQVKQSWPQSRAQDADSIVGKQVMLGGFWRRKDEFHRLNVGDKIECGLQHTIMASDGVNVAEQVKKLKAD